MVQGSWQFAGQARGRVLLGDDHRWSFHSSPQRVRELAAMDTVVAQGSLAEQRVQLLEPDFGGFLLVGRGGFRDSNSEPLGASLRI